MMTSDHLIVGESYTREILKDRFDITDATINTGIFQPEGHDSVWLFVTEEKTADRTQYHDLLDGDFLEWDSQPSGRKDHLIVMNERHLHRLLRDPVDYYNEDRVHTRLRDSPGGRPTESRPSSDAKIVGFPRVGGLHHRYAWREAA